MTGEGGGRCEVDDEVEGRDRVERMLAGDVGVMVGKTGPRCSTIGVKKLPARSIVGVKRVSDCDGETGTMEGWPEDNGEEILLRVSGEEVARGRRAREGTRESLSSGEGKRGGSSGGLGWRICASEVALTGRDGG
jgi:hypothetical protein